jgi:hypothetical protein
MIGFMLLGEPKDIDKPPHKAGLYIYMIYS